MDPVTAAILIGTAVAGADAANKSAYAQINAQREQQTENVKNQNSAVEKDYAKKVQGAQGLGGGFGQPERKKQPLGNEASQAGGILGGPEKNNVNSILG